jgi:hypothetical protein
LHMFVAGRLLHMFLAAATAALFAIFLTHVESIGWQKFGPCYLLLSPNQNAKADEH